MEIGADRFTGCLLGLAIGDALGAPYEGFPAENLYWQIGPVAEHLRQNTEELRFTDDTQMTMAVAETILACGQIETATLLQRLGHHFDPQRGYGQGSSTILSAVQRGEPVEEWTANLLPGGSYGNGAAMRSAPIGLRWATDLQQVAQQAERSAWPTHRHPWGVEGARLLALAVALAAAGPPLDRPRFYATMLEFCTQEEFRWQLRAARRLRRLHSLAFLGSSLPAHRSVVAALACFTTRTQSYESAVLHAISLGDDTDTLAAMTGALAGAHLGFEAIPTNWLHRLEDGPAGKTYLLQLATELYHLTQNTSNS